MFSRSEKFDITGFDSTYVVSFQALEDQSGEEPKGKTVRLVIYCFVFSVILKYLMYTIVLCLLSVGMILDFVENCFMVIVCLHISNLHVTRGVLCAQSRTSTMTMKHL